LQHLEVSCAVRRFFKSLGFKGLTTMQGQNHIRFAVSQFNDVSSHT